MHLPKAHWKIVLWNLSLAPEPTHSAVAIRVLTARPQLHFAFFLVVYALVTPGQDIPGPSSESPSWLPPSPQCCHRYDGRVSAHLARLLWNQVSWNAPLGHRKCSVQKHSTERRRERGLLLSPGGLEPPNPANPLLLPSASHTVSTSAEDCHELVKSRPVSSPVS